jgi:hypothetical protein
LVHGTLDSGGVSHRDLNSTKINAARSDVIEKAFVIRGIRSAFNGAVQHVKAMLPDSLTRLRWNIAGAAAATGFGRMLQRIAVGRAGATAEHTHQPSVGGYAERRRAAKSGIG